jgi:membrane associated rhomboid family serine protease
VIPVRDDVPIRSLPWVVTGLVAANLGVFLYELWLAAGPGGDARAIDFVSTWGLVPRELLRVTGPTGIGPAAFVTPLTATFLHADLLHLAGNMLYLVLFGSRIEDLLGHARFLLFYAACGLAAAAVHVASDPGSWAATLGASGAVSGVLGAYAVSYPTGRLRLLWPRVRVPVVVFLGLWFALQVGSAVGARSDARQPVAWWAHLGGFAAGAALARAMWVKKPTRSRLRI